MVARTRYQDDWVLNLHRAAQAAIGRELRIEYDPPRELTPELTVVLSRDLDLARYVFALTRDRFRQLRDVGCNPPRFVNSERVVAERLAVSVL